MEGNRSWQLAVSVRKPLPSKHPKLNSLSLKIPIKLLTQQTLSGLNTTVRVENRMNKPQSLWCWLSFNIGLKTSNTVLSLFLYGQTKNSTLNKLQLFIRSIPHCIHIAIMNRNGLLLKLQDNFSSANDSGLSSYRKVGRGLWGRQRLWYSAESVA